jgi:hypothetical protein
MRVKWPWYRREGLKCRGVPQWGLNKGNQGRKQHRGDGAIRPEDLKDGGEDEWKDTPCRHPGQHGHAQNGHLVSSRR